MLKESLQSQVVQVFVDAHLKGRPVLVSMKTFLILAILCGLYATYQAQNTISSYDIKNEIQSDEFYDKWEASADIKRRFTYYLAGYEDEGRPLWILEFGKWDFRKLVEDGPEKVKEFDIYADQFFYRVQKTIRESKNPEDGEPPTGWVCIFDMEKYNAWQLASPQAVLYILRLAGKFEIAARNMDFGYLINMNFLAERLIGILRPALGTTLDRAEISGTNKDRWLPTILKKVPRKILPEWYGGYKNFTPVGVYG